MKRMLVLVCNLQFSDGMRYQNNSSILLQVQGCEFSFFFALIAKAPCQAGSQVVPCCSICRSEVAWCEIRHAWCWVLYAHSFGHKGDIPFMGGKKKVWKEVSAVYKWEWDLFTFLLSSFEYELCLLHNISGAASILREEMVLSMPCLSLYSFWNEGDGLWLTQSCKKQNGEERERPGNSYG